MTNASGNGHRTGHENGHENGTRRTFLLSPANCNGRRGAMLRRPGSTIDLAVRLARGGAPLGEIFAFISGLYFRGKLTYARAFTSSAFIITPSRGLLTPDTIVTPDVLEEFSTVDVDAENARYRDPMDRDLATLVSTLSTETEVVLFGSIATGKYVDVLLPHLGDRLRFPDAFIGRGDMSRGGLMLRAAESGEELSYIPLAGATRRGARPPKLAPKRTMRV